MAFKFCSLPPELQLEVFKSLDYHSLAIASRVNKSISTDIMPLLWEDIDFQSTAGWYYGDIIDRMRDFFLVCDQLQKNRPSRWRQLATYVHTLKLARTTGAAIPFEDNDDYEFNWVFETEERSIFDIIADFSQLRCLHVYCKISFGSYTDTVSRMRDALPELRELVIGGNIDRGVVLGLLSYPEKMETLFVINLQDCQAGQERHSGGLLFLEPLAPRFTSLTYLHLCKLAELVNTESEVTALRWDFDYENDRAVLSEWAMLLQHVSATLVELKLEDRYLVSKGKLQEHDIIWPGDGEGDDPKEWGQGSRGRFGEIVLPVLNSQEWPKLQRLILTGVVLDEAKESDEKVQRYLRNLHSRLDVEIWPGRFVEFNDESTPIEISPPESPFGGVSG